jgi:hypothetical protein
MVEERAENSIVRMPAPSFVEALDVVEPQPWRLRESGRRSAYSVRQQEKLSVAALS